MTIGETIKRLRKEVADLKAAKASASSPATYQRYNELTASLRERQMELNRAYGQLAQHQIQAAKQRPAAEVAA